MQAILLGCTALVAFVPAGLRAQEASNTDSNTVLGTITVDGSGTGADDDARSIVATRTSGGSKMATPILDTPASISVITAKEIQQRGAESVEQILQYTSGITTDFYGSDDRFDFFKIRGFDAYTYRDGLTLGAPFGAVREEAYAFERVEVMKGANSTAFGVSDPGGAVNYITKRPKSGRFGEAYVTGGSFNRAEVGFDFGDNITSDDTLSYRLTGKIKDANAEYDYSRNDEKFVMGGLTWRPADTTSVTVVVDYLNRDAVPGSGGHPVGTDFDRSRFFGEPDYNYRGTNRTNVSVMLEHDFGSGLNLSSNARYSDTKSDFGYAYISGTPTNGSTVANRAFFGNESWGDTFIADTRLQYDTSFSNIDSRTLLGVEYRDATSNTKASWGAAPGIDWLNPVYTGAPVSVPVYSSTRSDQKTKAIYLQQDLTFAEKFIASFGLRNDWMDIRQSNRLAGTSAEGDISEFTTRVGLTYKVTEQFSTYASYAQSAIPASLTVEPERGEQYEVGVKYSPAGSNALISAALFDLTKKNITRTDPITTLPSTIGEVRVRGLDLEAKAELQNNISLTAAYAYLDSEIVRNGTAGNEGKSMDFVPRHQASLWFNYELEGEGSRGDMTFGLGARYKGSYYFNQANTLSTGAHVVFDAAFNYKIQENTSLSLNVSNLFDKKHVSYGGFGADFYNPGREISLTLRRTW